MQYFGVLFTSSKLCRVADEIRTPSRGDNSQLSDQSVQCFPLTLGYSAPTDHGHKQVCMLVVQISPTTLTYSSLSTTNFFMTFYAPTTLLIILHKQQNTFFFLKNSISLYFAIRNHFKHFSIVHNQRISSLTFLSTWFHVCTYITFNHMHSLISCTHS